MVMNTSRGLLYTNIYIYGNDVHVLQKGGGFQTRPTNRASMSDLHIGDFETKPTYMIFRLDLHFGRVSEPDLHIGFPNQTYTQDFQTENFPNDTLTTTYDSSRKKTNWHNTGCLI